MMKKRSESDSSDFGDENERLIPDIPGVSFSETETDWRAQADEPDEESEEDLLEEIEQEVRNVLTHSGVESVHNANSEQIIQLWHRMDMSAFLIGDLVLQTTTNKQDSLQNSHAWPNINDVFESSETLVNPYDVRVDLTAQAAPNLIKLGYSELDAYRLPRSANEGEGRAFRVEGWLLDLPFLGSLPERIKSMGLRATRRGSPAIFRATIDEIIRQGHILESETGRKKYDFRIGYENEAYRLEMKRLKNAYRLAQFALSDYSRPK